MMPRHYTLNFYKLTAALFFFLLLFSNLISRIVGANLNLLFYLAFLLILLLSIKRIKWNGFTIFPLVVLIFYCIYLVDIRYDLAANLLTVKDVFVPILCFYIGYCLKRYEKDTFNLLNWLFPLFVVYGIIQEIAFYTGNLDQVLPWDASYIAAAKDAEIKNIYQGPLLRFFGTMNAFVEYQVHIVFLPMFLWLNHRLIKQRKLLIVNTGLMIAFTISSLERSPICMLIILLAVWRIKFIITNHKQFILACFALIAIASIFVINQRSLKNSPTLGIPYDRLTNVLTFNMGADDAFQDRKSRIWKEAISLSTDNYFGIGPGRVTPSASGNPFYFAPHNNYLVYYLAYGIIGLMLFISLIIIFTVKLSKASHEYRYFGYGVIVSYAAMAMFNVPFMGKQGILFFIMIGFLCHPGFSTRNKYLHIKRTGFS